MVVIQSAIMVIIGKWTAYPMAIVAYTYLFGFLFMFMANLYYVLTGQLDQFLIPYHVRERHNMSYAALNPASNPEPIEVSWLESVLLSELTLRQFVLT